jgi:YidC/Oxa1 family membrane protein insertase
MNRNAVIFVIASVAVLLAYNRLVDRIAPLPKAPAAAAPAPNATPALASAPVASAGPAASGVFAPVAHASAASLRPSEEKRVALETGTYKVELTTAGARFTSLKLKGVLKQTGGDGSIVDLVPSTDNPRHGTLEYAGTELDSMAWTLLTPQAVMEQGRPTVRFRAEVPGTGLEFTKSFSFDPEKPGFDVEIDLKNNGKEVKSLLSPLSFVWGPDLGGDGGGIGQVPPAGVVQLDQRIERERASKDQATLDYAAPRWVALKNHYFVFGVFPVANTGWTRAEVRKLGQMHIATALQAEGLSVAPGETKVLRASVWAGPQEYTALKAVGGNFQSVVQFQFYSWFEWLNPLCVGLLYIMKWFYAVTGNWGVAIILLTLLVRGVLFYPSMKSMVSMRHMQNKQAAMKPRLETLKKTYKDNPQKLNEETMKLYKEFGVNPLGGCLPMLVQIPIFFSLYGTLAAAYELRGASFIWVWNDLTAGDPTYLFPIAMGVSMFVQQKMAPTAASMSEEQQQMQKMMLWMMPMMFTGMALFMHWPVGLLLYWTASNLMGVVQQIVVNKVVED